MATTPWLTSDQIVESIKRRIAIPISQETFSPDDLLRFTNEVLFDSQVPSVAKLHEEFYVYPFRYLINSNQRRYPIPHRAMWMKLRDAFFEDTNHNLYQLTRINPDDQDIFQSTTIGQANPYTFFVENNDIVLTSLNPVNNGAYLYFTFFLRPNKLVANERAFTVSSFSQNIIVDNTSIVAGDTITITTPQSDLDPNAVVTTYTAVASGAGLGEFNIGASSILTASNLVNAINTGGLYSATNQSPATSTVSITYNNRSIEFTTSNAAGFIISPNLVLNGASVPSNITNSSYIDFLQTKPGHKIYSYSVLLGVNAVSSTALTVLNTLVPDDFVVGDYVCSEYECIIPQLPPELHSLLVERACERILSAQGDLEQLANVQNKIQMLEKNQDMMVDNRIDGSPQKIVNRNSLLQTNKYRVRNVT